MTVDIVQQLILHPGSVDVSHVEDFAHLVVQSPRSICVSAIVPVGVEGINHLLQFDNIQTNLNTSDIAFARNN